MSTFKKVDFVMVDLDGPYECSVCGFHMMLDATFIEQVDGVLVCPSCRTEAEVDDAVEIEPPAHRPEPLTVEGCAPITMRSTRQPARFV